MNIYLNYLNALSIKDFDGHYLSFVKAYEAGYPEIIQNVYDNKKIGNKIESIEEYNRIIMSNDEVLPEYILLKEYEGYLYKEMATGELINMSTRLNFRDEISVNEAYFLFDDKYNAGIKNIFEICKKYNNEPENGVNKKLSMKK